MEGNVAAMCGRDGEERAEEQLLLLFCCCAALAMSRLGLRGGEIVAVALPLPSSSPKAVATTRSAAFFIGQHIDGKQSAEQAVEKQQQRAGALVMTKTRPTFVWPGGGGWPSDERRLRRHNRREGGGKGLGQAMPSQAQPTRSLLLPLTVCGGGSSPIPFNSFLDCLRRRRPTDNNRHSNDGRAALWPNGKEGAGEGEGRCFEKMGGGEGGEKWRWLMKRRRRSREEDAECRDGTDGRKMMRRQNEKEDKWGRTAAAADRRYRPTTTNAKQSKQKQTLEGGRGHISRTISNGWA
ncbi:hypothetical protein niasHS_007229 [Heterodera schachtii]|uniref:Uncharacterized protein n=1 Tax=Heterodera schachtii TaxID=97005 RepID=A0ABD2JJS2_HETSC